MADDRGEGDGVARAVAEALMAREGTAPAWGLVLEDARPGFARVAMVVRPDMLNGHGTAHGGMVFALADTAFAYACNSRDEATVGQQASIVFLSPAQLGERLVAEAREVAAAGRGGVYAVSVSGADGRAVAEFQGLSRKVGGPVLRETDGG